jgi:predicted transcriptional regulator
MPRKLIRFHPEDFRALEQLAEDRSSSLQELMDKAVSDFLEKSGRPTNLREALRESASKSAPQLRKRPAKRR